MTRFPLQRSTLMFFSEMTILGGFDLFTGLVGFFSLFIAGRSGARMVNPTPFKECAEGRGMLSEVLVYFQRAYEIKPLPGNVVPCIEVVRPSN